jgi:site-specific DNA-cytosine methylase
MIDVFAGGGGMTRGFVDTGRFSPVLAVEMDPYAAATYAANFVAEGVSAERHVITDRIESVDEFPQVDRRWGDWSIDSFKAHVAATNGEADREALAAELFAGRAGRTVRRIVRAAIQETRPRGR